MLFLSILSCVSDFIRVSMDGFFTTPKEMVEGKSSFSCSDLCSCLPDTVCKMGGIDELQYRFKTSSVVTPSRSISKGRKKGKPSEVVHDLLAASAANICVQWIQRGKCSRRCSTPFWCVIFGLQSWLVTSPIAPAPFRQLTSMPRRRLQVARMEVTGLTKKRGTV